MTAEHQFQMSDWSDDTKSIQMGKAINANYLARAILAPLDSTVNLLQIRILDVNTARILGRANEIEFTTLRDARGKLDIFLKDVTSSITTDKAPTAKEYKIGDRGPAGGWIFYDQGVFANGWRYLEAAPSETEFSAEWGAYGKDVSGTASAVGSGKQNTKLIVNYLKKKETGRAAQLCDSIVMGNFVDWYLPSKDELNLMYQNLHKKGLGGFSNNRYWSSSQKDSSWSWFCDFRIYSQDDYYLKNNTFSVRAVRAF
jgi:hypothetical protein